MAGAIPAAKLDAELERALRLAHELRFVDLQQLVEVLQRRQCRLADAHRADVIGLDERHRVARGMQYLCAGSRAHPAGGATADDHDAQGRCLHYLSPLPHNTRRRREGAGDAWSHDLDASVLESYAE